MLYFNLPFAPRKGIQDILGFWNPGTEFQYFSVELGFWIPIASLISNSLSCTPDSKTRDSGFHKQRFPRFRNVGSLHGANPWFKFYFPLVWVMVMYDNWFGTKKRKFKPRIKLNPTCPWPRPFLGRYLIGYLIAGSGLIGFHNFAFQKGLFNKLTKEYLNDPSYLFSPKNNRRYVF